MSTFTELKALFASTPIDLASAWDEATRLFATLADERERGALADELAAERIKNLKESLIDQIRDALADAGKADFDYVLFLTEEWDDGSFLRRAAEVVTDGESEEFEFSWEVEDTMTDIYGRVSRDAGLGFHNRTATLEFDDYAANVRKTMDSKANG